MGHDPALLNCKLLLYYHTPAGAAAVPGVVFLLAIWTFAGDGLTSLVLCQALFRVVPG